MTVPPNLDSQAFPNTPGWSTFYCCHPEILANYVGYRQVRSPRWDADVRSILARGRRYLPASKRRREQVGCLLELPLELRKLFAQALHLFGKHFHLMFKLRNSLGRAVSTGAGILGKLHLCQSFKIQFAA
jgi:hypothetical protein